MHIDNEQILNTIVNLDIYPITKINSKEYADTIKQIKNQLNLKGCVVLKNFVKKSQLGRLKNEGESIAPKAYYSTETVNVYNTNIDEKFPKGHPGNIKFQRGNAFVARDLIPSDFIISRLYKNLFYKKFIANCFGVNKVYELQDPLSALCLNVLKPQKSHPWHFDINEFTISLLTKKPQSGGEFEYCQNIRSPKNENIKSVKDVITNSDSKLVESIELQEGDLQLFQGRYALHRVKEINGSKDRHTAIFAYSEIPNIVATTERTKQLFGRVNELHDKTNNQNQRVDTLID